MAESPLLSLQDVAIQVGGKPLLSGVSFTVSRGEIVCILGNNGAGKSTLFRACAGLSRVVGGSITLAGRAVWEISDEARRPLVAWCPQALERVSGFSGLQFVALATELDRFLRGRGGSVPAERRFFEECLEKFDAKTLAHRDISVLSGGEWKRVQLARVWAQGAKLALLDEPSTGLDLRHISLLAQRIRSEARERGTAFLLSTHDLSLALAVADTLIFMHEGRLWHQGSRENLLESGVFEEVFGVPFRWMREGERTLTVPVLE